MTKLAVLFVCTGNICRSPTAEAVFRQAVQKAGLEQSIHVDSAGTHSYHIGHPPDERSQAHAQRRGYDLANLRARQLEKSDFSRFDYILIMDDANLSAVQQRFPSDADKVQKLLEFSPQATIADVPDPYYGGERGFETVLDLIEDAAQGLLGHIKADIEIQSEV